MREKLIELLKESAQCPHIDDDEIICCDECEWFVEGESCCPPRMADYLIANGVTVNDSGTIEKEAGHIRKMDRTWDIWGKGW